MNGRERGEVAPTDPEGVQVAASDFGAQGGNFHASTKKALADLGEG
jgi:hypothetical protein